MSASSARASHRARWLAAGLACIELCGACEPVEGSCLRMSDCESGYVCIEGTCRSEPAADAAKPTGSMDAAVTSSGDAATNVGVGDATTDGDPTDAATDR